MIYKYSTVESRCNEGPENWQNMFEISRFYSIYFTTTGRRISFVMARTSLYRVSAVYPLRASPTHLEKITQQMKTYKNFSSPEQI